MTMGQIIASARRERGLTQEALAIRLGVSNQAVSKWESDQCYPDITLLPKLAEVFSVSIDVLFGRTEPPAAAEEEHEKPEQPEEAERHGQRESVHAGTLPWADDKTMRVVVYIGHTLLAHMDAAKDMFFTYYGDACDVYSALNLVCGDVNGNATAGAALHCGNVTGDAAAGEALTCEDVGGNVIAGTQAQTGNVGGNIEAGTNVSCGDVGGDVNAGGSASCGDVGGDVHCTFRTWYKR